MADQYDVSIFTKASKKAQENRRFDAYAVKRILENDYPELSEKVAQDAGIISPVIPGDVDESGFDSFSSLDSINKVKNNDSNK